MKTKIYDLYIAQFFNMGTLKPIEDDGLYWQVIRKVNQLCDEEVSNG